MRFARNDLRQKGEAAANDANFNEFAEFAAVSSGQSL